MPQKNEPHLMKSRNPNVRIKFRTARINQGKTQKEVASDLGLKESYVRFVENRHVNPSFKKMITFEKYFGIPAKELFPDLYIEAEQLAIK